MFLHPLSIVVLDTNASRFIQYHCSLVRQLSYNVKMVRCKADIVGIQDELTASKVRSRDCHHFPISHGSCVIAITRKNVLWGMWKS
jgi:hypothetical protein